jgi:hypothetical protein
MEARVFGDVKKGLGLGGIAVLALWLAGCSTAGQADSTAAIAPPAADATAVASNGTQDGQAVAQQPGIGKAITLADATCDQIKAEVAVFEADKIPQKLADFGKAKYHPTAEESIRFARYVDVSKAAKDKNCTPAAKAAKKPLTAQKSSVPVDPASKKKASTASVTAAKAPDATAKVVMKKPATILKPVAPAPDPGAAADEGVTVTVPDSSG